jgi:hypothetical protein
VDVVRVYTGDDGESHFEHLDIPLEEGPYGRMSQRLPATGVIFRETQPGSVLDFHTAPRRQFVIVLSGSAELECGDGTVHRLGPGDVLLADDTTGHGHISRDIDGPRRSIFLPLTDDFDVSRYRAGGG